MTTDISKCANGRFGVNHTCRGKKKIIQAIQNPKLITHETIEHKPYWDVSTEVDPLTHIPCAKFSKK